MQIILPSLSSMMMCALRPYIAILISFLVNAALFAQDSCTIVGAVVDEENGMHIPSALLLFEKGSIAAVADNDGRFAFNVAPEEHFRFLVERPLYHPLQLSGRASPGAHIAFPIELKPRGHILVALSEIQENTGYLAIIISRSAAATAKGEGLVGGSVLDREPRKPASNVNVFLRGTTRRTSTDSLGNFQLAIPADTTCTLAISHAAYDKDWFDVNVEENKQINVRIQLNLSETSTHEVGAIRDLPSKDPGAFYVDEEDIERLAPINFRDLLYSRFPQLSWARTEMGKFNGAIFFLYVDGFAWNRWYLNHIDAYAVRRMILWKGARAPSRYRTDLALYVVEVMTYR